MDHARLDPDSATEASRDTSHVAGAAAAGDTSQPGIDAASDPLARYPDLYSWVTEWLLAVYRRSTTGAEQTWCTQWWRHPEVVVRLTALWRAWLAAQQEDGGAMSAWWAYHADHHLPIILSSRGPLKGCTPEQHTTRPTPPLQTTPPDTPIFAELQHLTPSPAAQQPLDDDDLWPTTPTHAAA
ncbi:MAG: DUF4913 domain-containing protein [Solirubrobacteraceae bacterium]